MNNNQIKFSPVSRTMSNVGSTVTYSLNPTTTVSASHTGNFNNISGWNSHLSNSGYANMQHHQNNMNNYGVTQTTPLINASQFNNQLSGNFVSNQFPQNRCYVRSAMVQPSIDISETSSDVIVSASVSNVEVEDLNLNVTDNSVTISGMAWTGREHIALNRTVALSTSVRAELIDANIQSGVLEIRCPKSERMIRQRTTINSDSVHTDQE